MLDTESRHLLLVHGADRLGFHEDTQQAEKRGMNVHALALPRFDGHPVDDVHTHYAEVSDVIQAEVDLILAPDPQAFVVGIGRNLGGSMLAYWAMRSSHRLGAIVLTGAIPDLSRFKARGTHAGARRYREMVGSVGHADQFSKLADLDLVATLPAIAANDCLLQAGLSDPWLDDVSFAVFRDIDADGYRVEYLEDDHAMVAPVSLERRWRFIDTMMGGR